MKVAERLKFEGDRLVIEKTNTAAPALATARHMRDVRAGMSGDHRCAGIVPKEMVAVWLKQAGVSWSDTKARDEVIRKNLQSRDYSAFRVWNGRF